MGKVNSMVTKTLEVSYLRAVQTKNKIRAKMKILIHETRENRIGVLKALRISKKRVDLKVRYD